jgi:hypothetical protein
MPNKMLLKNTDPVKSMWAVAKADEDSNRNLKSKIIKLDDKLQQMLLWSNICILWACIILIFTIAKIYKSFTGNHPVLMTCTLTLIAVFFAVFMFFVWKNIKYKNAGFKKASKTYLHYQVRTLSGQLRLISGYLIIYALIILVAGMFFYQDINNGLSLLFKTTAPTSIIIYSIGFYFIISFNRQLKRLKLLEQQVDAISFMEKVVQN